MADPKDNPKSPKLVKKETAVGPVYVNEQPSLNKLVNDGVNLDPPPVEGMKLLSNVWKDYIRSRKIAPEVALDFRRKIEMEHKKPTLRARLFPTVKDLIGYNSSIDEITFFRSWARNIIVTGLLAYGGCQAIGNNIEYSQGIRTGMINKISEKGLFWKTYEGQMALEGIVSGKNSVGANVWDFSLDRQARQGENPKELAEQIREYLETGTKVKVTYKEPLATWPWRSGTDYPVQKVEPIKEK